MSILLPPALVTRRRRLLLLALLTVPLGLGSRRYAAALPAWLTAYAGDTLWALLVFWLVALLRPRWPVLRVGLAAFGLTLAVETSQLYQAPWLNALRHTTLGGLVLGFGFLWSDVLCYGAGVLIGYALERHWRVSPITLGKLNF
ncbi:ribosomal maturation YjgA family protein [Hymenobacter rubripertinctus]|uniref:DUF2809 domain-containing protein n=1 Tax=Hymenobacter rubripertinctus TaxID=2029981 RepID=A0A418R0R4_9BACT|nr:DUF2809 domain-containing protein [Hymenobacter rubripertinctus]RIY10985.1 DUF2809 domain-containing protein [Hymenobacter rubripertinctus]